MAVPYEQTGPWGCCMIWKYALNDAGYGTLAGTQDPLAHRQAFIHAYGKIPVRTETSMVSPGPVPNSPGPNLVPDDGRGPR